MIYMPNAPYGFLEFQTIFEPSQIQDACPPIKQPIWAVAYDIDNDTLNCRARCLPAYGEIRDSRKAWTRYAFSAYKKNSHELCVTEVSTHARHYADTKEEAIALYNALVDFRIAKCNNIIESCHNDYIN